MCNRPIVTVHFSAGLPGAVSTYLRCADPPNTPAPSLSSTHALYRQASNKRHGHWAPGANSRIARNRKPPFCCARGSRTRRGMDPLVVTVGGLVVQDNRNPVRHRRCRRLAIAAVRRLSLPVVGGSPRCCGGGQCPGSLRSERAGVPWALGPPRTWGGGRWCGWGTGAWRDPRASGPRRYPPSRQAPRAGAGGCQGRCRR